MPSNDPTNTALALAVGGLLVAASVVFSRALGKRGVPVVLLFLGIGVLAGSEGLGGIEFHDFETTARVGTIALAFILFQGGLRTRVETVRRVLAPAGVLATFAVAASAAIVALAGWALGLPWMLAWLLGAVVSSTDAAAVFAVLRSGGVQLQPRVAATLEVESGLNDPMAVILTVAITAALASGEPIGWGLAGSIVVQFLVGGALGVVVGYFGRALLRRGKPLVGALYPVLSLAVAALAFGIPTLLGGSGFLSVYIAGMLLGNARLPYESAILHVHDFVAWLSQIIMFLVLGLLVFPSRLLDIAPIGLALAAVLVLVARPLSVAVSLAPFRYTLREVSYIAWVGLRGAVPIVLASLPVLAGVRGSELVFDIVFFVVVVSATVQGLTVAPAARWLRVEDDAPAPPQAIVEITSLHPLRDEIITIHVPPSSPLIERSIAELEFPDRTAAMLIVRGVRVLVPRGDTRLQAGDYVFVFVPPERRHEIKALFERAVPT